MLEICAYAAQESWRYFLSEICPQKPKCSSSVSSTRCPLKSFGRRSESLPMCAFFVARLYFMSSVLTADKQTSTTSDWPTPAVKQNASCAEVSNTTFFNFYLKQYFDHKNTGGMVCQNRKPSASCR